MQPQQSTKIQEIKYKIVFLGQMTTGKTSIIQRFSKSRFDQGLKSTLGIDLITKNIYFKSNNYRLQLWDTAGQQQFRSLVPNYLRDAHCTVFVYDVCDEKSFENLTHWLQLYKNNESKDSIAILVGNKIDKKSQRKIMKQKGSQWAIKHQMSFIQVSAKSGQGIEDIFYSIIQNINTNQPITSQRQLLPQLNRIQEQARQTDRTLKGQSNIIQMKKVKSINSISIGQKHLDSFKLNKNTKLQMKNNKNKNTFFCCYI